MPPFAFTLTSAHPDSLRVALLAGTLDQGGAEKQLVYMTRALKAVGVDVQVYSLTQGEFYEQALRRAGAPPIWVGAHGHPLARLAAFTKALAAFRPHIVQATHFFANLYVALAGRLHRALEIGSIRNDAVYELQQNGRWGPWLLRTPASLLANSQMGCDNAERLGIPPTAIHLLSNVIDLEEFDASVGPGWGPRQGSEVRVLAVGRLVAAKRFDRFLSALAAARRLVPEISGALVGDGPEREALEQHARSLSLHHPRMTFLGRRSDVPSVLRDGDMLVLCSEHEGFPNVVLESMAARVPIITTPVGDAARIIKDDVTGYIVPSGDENVLVDRIVRLARSAEDRRRLGDNARREVERRYSLERLGSRLLATYGTMAERQGNKRVLSLLARRLQMPVAEIRGAR